MVIARQNEHAASFFWWWGASGGGGGGLWVVCVGSVVGAGGEGFLCTRLDFDRTEDLRGRASAPAQRSFPPGVPAWTDDRTPPRFRAWTRKFPRPSPRGGPAVSARPACRT